MALLRLGPRDRVLDAGCGHGRHARVIAPRVAALVGLERSGEYLRKATSTSTSTPTPTPTATPTATAPPTPSALGPLESVRPERSEAAPAAERSRRAAAPPLYLRADLRALPLRPRTLDAAYSWYASLFMFDDETNAAALAGIGGALRPGGRLLVHHANPLRLASVPDETSRRVLRDGSVVEEESRYDAVRGVDRCARRLRRPDGRVLEGTAELRYYTPSEWLPLARRAGLRVVDVTSTTDAGRPGRPPPGPEAPDLIVLLETPT